VKCYSDIVILFPYGIISISGRRQTPPVLVPAKSIGNDAFAALGESDQTMVFVIPGLTAVQLDPLFAERKTPSPRVAAKRTSDAFLVTTVSALTFVFVKPVLTGDQFVLVSVERTKTPPEVPAKSFGEGEFRPLTASV
jgi:hypothetical protein